MATFEQPGHCRTSGSNVLLIELLQHLVREPQRILAVEFDCVRPVVGNQGDAAEPVISDTDVGDAHGHDASSSRVNTPSATQSSSGSSTGGWSAAMSGGANSAR